MTLQLTKTKTITIGGGAKAKKRRYADVVGVDLFAGDARGCPAVRIALKKGAWRVMATGFVPPPAAALPSSWEEAAKSCSWSLPSAFQAPSAALALNSDTLFVAQTTAEAVLADVKSGAHRSSEAEAAPKVRRFGIRREQKADAPAEKSPAEAPAPAANVTVEPAVPVSNGGTRFVMRPMAGDGGFVLEAGLPEYQILWLARLLPEGRRPTAASVQPAGVARAASVLKNPKFAAAGGNALILFLTDDRAFIAGYKAGDLVLWRMCPGVPGARAIRTELKKAFGVEDDMVDGVLNGELVDPRPVLERLLAPALNELAVSRDYLVGKLGLTLGEAFVTGPSTNAAFWNGAADEIVRMKTVRLETFGGLEGNLPDAKDADAFAGALGAALALVTEEDG